MDHRYFDPVRERVQNEYAELMQKIQTSKVPINEKYKARRVERKPVEKKKPKKKKQVINPSVHE